MLGLLAKFLLFAVATTTSTMGAGALLGKQFPHLTQPPRVESPQAPSAVLGSATDPIVRCGPGQNSGQYISVRKSECDNSTDCHLSDGSWKLMKKTECNAIQKRSPNPVASNAVVSGPKIDCTGPDGVHFQTTQVECDDFNAAWGKPNVITCYVKGQKIVTRNWADCEKAAAASSQSTNSSPQQTQSTGNSVYCWNNTYNVGYYTTSGDKCNDDNFRDGTNKLCQDSQKFKLDLCNRQCQREHDENKAACDFAYTGQNYSDKYGECLNGAGGVGELYGVCLDKCNVQFKQDLGQCK